MKFSVAVTLLFAALCAGKKSYDGYSVYRITPRTERAGNFIQELSENVNFGQSLDFWHESRNLGDPTDVMVPPRYKALVEDFLRRRHMEFSLLVENVEDVIYPQAGGCGTDSTDPAFYNCYHTMDEIESWMDGIVDNYPGRASKEAVSATIEGRTVSAIKISGTKANRPAVIFQGGIHAREWISPATMMNIAKMLLDDYGVDAEVTAIIEHYDIYIIPVLNQDGYAYTWTDDRMWRKNRRTPSSGRCYGVDLNRNWDVDFGGDGTSKTKCSEVYHGAAALSEPETSGIDAWSRALQASTGVEVFIDFHSYGQYWMWPWGYKVGLPNTPDHDDQMSACHTAAAALESVFGTEYTVQTSAAMYAAAGATEDWAYHSLGAKYSYIVELRPTSDAVGFQLPENKIEPTGIETYEGVKALLKETSADVNPIAEKVAVLP